MQAQSALASPGPAATAPADAERTRWFREGRFGLFIHWGVYAVPAGEWQGKPVKGIGEWILQRAKIPVADYKAFAQGFTASKYDPAAWAALARRAGMKYVVVTTKHHDGFALFDSTASDWNAVKASGARRDLIAPLAAAVRAEGIKFGAYYSQSLDWINPGGATGKISEWDPAQKGDYDAYLKNVSLPQVREIIERYDPALIWWDIPTKMSPKRAKPFTDLLAAHPAIMSNNRLDDTWSRGDTRTPEQHIPPRGYPGKLFEVCMTMNDTWGFKKNDVNWKSVRVLLRALSDIASKGGNFLLNVGPTAEGEIPAASIERLESIGRWMDVNGEAIHATEAGPFSRRLPWGRVTQKRAADGATSLYLQVWNWPADGRIVLPTVTQVPRAGRLLAGGAATRAQASAEGLVVMLPGSAPDPDVSVVRLDFDQPVVVNQQPFFAPGADGRVTCNAADADPHGSNDGNIELLGTGDAAYLGKWKDPKFRLEYRLQTPAAGKWIVTAEIAAPAATSLVMVASKKEQSASIEATGPGLTWRTVTLGTLELPAGETGFELKGPKDGWKPINVRTVWLTPVR